MSHVLRRRPNYARRIRAYNRLIPWCAASGVVAVLWFVIVMVGEFTR